MYKRICPVDLSLTYKEYIGKIGGCYCHECQRICCMMDVATH